MTNPAINLHHTDAVTFLKGLKSESVDIIITDPPYGIGYQSSFLDNRFGSIKGKPTKKRVREEPVFTQIQGDEFAQVDWLAQAYRVLKPDSALYIFAHWRTFSTFVQAAEVARFAVKDCIVINKSNHGMGDLRSYGPKYELLIFATKGRHKLKFEHRPSNVWPGKLSPVQETARHHPNEKHIEWILPALRYSTRKLGELVVDPFMGSGSTGVAAVSVGHRFAGAEISAGWFQTAVERLTPWGRVVTHTSAVHHSGE